MMPPDSKLRLKKLNKKCNRCPCLFSVSKNSRIIFCDNRPGRLIDHYANKEELVADFLKNNFSFCHLSKKASAPPRRTFAPPDVRLIKIKDYVLPSFRYLMINYSCNNNCLFCYLGSSKKKADPGPKQILNSIDQIKEKSITIFGGEPTLNKNLFKILEHARRRKKKLKITTNGRRLADRAFCKNFLSFNFNQVTVSLHSYLKKDHESLTRSPGYEQTILGIKNIVQLKPRSTSLRANIVINKINYRYLKKLVHFAVNLGFEIIRFNILGREIKKGKFPGQFPAINPKKTIPHLMAALDYLEKIKHIKYYVSNHPLCFFPKKYWPRLSNRRLFLEAYNDQRYFQTTATLSEKCLDCAVKTYCPGLYPKVLSYYGSRLTKTLKPRPRLRKLEKILLKSIFKKSCHEENNHQSHQPV